MPALSESRAPMDLPTVILKDGALHATHPSAGPDDLAHIVGRTLGVYECESLLGHGAMGWVFLARHRELHRACAVKILAPGLLARDSDAADRFLNEARAAASLCHPNVLTIHAVGVHSGLQFIEMEFVPGRSLQHLIDTTVLSPVRATTLAIEIASGLAAAHRAGILHRDLKPDNVMLTPAGAPKICDFGLAKRVTGLSTEAEGAIAGTPNYMAPEVFCREAPTAAADVYALGVCYFVMLTQSLPFHGGTISDLMYDVIRQPAPDVRLRRRDIPREMADAVALMLAKAPADRPRDADEAAKLLRTVLGQVRDVESLLHESLDNEPGTVWTPSNGQYRVDVALSDARRQTVWIVEDDRKQSDRVVSVYSVCCPSHPAYYENALRLNADVCHGALAIRDVDGTPHLIMVNSYPRSTVDPEEIRRSVWEIASHSDALERALTAVDRQ